MHWQQWFPGYLTGSCSCGPEYVAPLHLHPYQASDILKIPTFFSHLWNVIGPSADKIPMKIKRTMAFQTGDIRDLLTRSRDPQLDGVSSGLMPDSRLENARNARLLLDRRPCSTYWLLVGRSRGTMSKMSSHTIGNRHLWLFGPGKKWKVLVLPLAHRERCCSGQTPLTFLDHVWKAEEKVSPNSARLSHLGWFKGPVITFLSHCFPAGIPALWCF